MSNVRKLPTCRILPRVMPYEPWQDTKARELVAINRRERRYRIGLAWIVVGLTSALVAFCVWLVTP